MVIGKSWTWAALAAIVIAVLGTAGCNNASQDEAKPSLVTHERLDFASNRSATVLLRTPALHRRASARSRSTRPKPSR